MLCDGEGGLYHGTVTYGARTGSGYSRRQAVQAFRRDFDCIGKHFIVIEY